MKSEGLIWAGVHVADLAAAVVFYRDALGLRLMRQGDGWAHFDAGGGAMLELIGGGRAAPAAKEPERQSIVIGLRVADLDQAVAELQSRGVVFLGEIGKFKRTRWAQFADPEGNRLEIKELPGD